MSERSRENAEKVLNNGSMDIPEMEDILALYRELMPVIRQELKPAEPIRVPTSEEQKMRLSEGFTLVDPVELMPEKDSLAARAMEVYKVLENHSESVEAAEGELFADADKVHELARIYLADGEEALRGKAEEAGGVNPERAMFVIYNSLKPVFQAAGRVFADVDTETWEAAGCPVCGGLPTVAYMEGEGGKRFLVCHRCESDWRFMRIQCPYCGNKDHEKLGYFTIEEEDETTRVDFCRECTSYLKTWDIREKEGPVPEIIDLLTPGFDLAAEKEGFNRGAPNIFGVWLGFEEEEE
jgi:FdhE protein